MFRIYSPLSHLLDTKGINAWYTGKIVRSKITGKKLRQISYTVNSKGRTGAANRLKLMRRKRRS